MENLLNEIHPRVYVGTYKKYRNGDLSGAWVDLTEFGDYYEFLDRCEELHGDESHPEFMIQDFENYPDEVYNECGMDEDEFYNIIKYWELSQEYDATALEDFVDEGHDINDFEDAYVGEYDEEDFAIKMYEELVQEIEDRIPGADKLTQYIDWDAVGRDLMINNYWRSDNGFVFRCDGTY